MYIALEFADEPKSFCLRWAWWPIGRHIARTLTRPCRSPTFATFTSKRAVDPSAVESETERGAAAVEMLLLAVLLCCQPSSNNVYCTQTSHVHAHKAIVSMRKSNEPANSCQSAQPVQSRFKRCTDVSPTSHLRTETRAPQCSTCVSGLGAR